MLLHWPKEVDVQQKLAELAVNFVGSAEELRLQISNLLCDMDVVCTCPPKLGDDGFTCLCIRVDGHLCEMAICFGRVTAA